MMLLIAGLLIWSLVHLLRTISPGARQGAIDRIGLWPYKGLFSLVLVGALVLIVMGWRAIPPSALWNPPSVMHGIAFILMPLAGVLFFTAVQVLARAEN